MSVERDDEGILIDEALVDVLVRSVDGQRAITPRAVRQNDGGESPVVHELRKSDIATDLGVGHEGNAGLRELFVDRPILLPAQGLMPARESVFDFPIGASVLFDDRDGDAAVRQSARDLGSRRRSTDDRYVVSSRFVCHDSNSRR
jgi:hypothetical protein